MSKIKPLLFLITIILLASSVFSFVFFQNVWLLRKWNIPIDPPGFHDSRQFAWAAEAYAQGYDPLIKNPVNPRGHQLNYPRIWHLLFALGINESHVNILGSIVVILFFIGIGIFWFSGKFNNLTYVILSIAILSSAVMLGIERSNIELVLFFILSLAIAVNYSSSTLALPFFLFASFLKLYPIFGFVYLLKENKKKFWSLFLIALGIFTIYFFYTFIDTMRVYTTTPQLPNSSMGMNVWWLGLNNRRLFDLHLSPTVILYLKTLSYVMVFLIVTGALFLSFRNKELNRFREGEYIDSFRVGAGIYIGCFIAIINADYRLIFLIFTIPQLVSWSYSNERGFSPVPLVTLSAMLFSLWSSFFMHFLGRKTTFILEESCNWIVLAGLLYLFLSSLPDWFRGYLRRPFSRIKVFRGIAS
jgi:hypothetical protein